MSPTQKWLLFASVLLLVLLAVSAYMLAGHEARGLGESPRISFPGTAKSPQDLSEFVAGNFEPIATVEKLPKPVRLAFTEVGGSRLTMANAGQKFQATDTILNPGLPRRRLILAGVSGEKCFVEYEQGGFAKSIVLALFNSDSPGSLEPVWQGNCANRAADLNSLRELVKNGDCK